MATKCPKADTLCKTRDVSIKTSILWTIDNFSLCPEKTGEYLNSCTFSAKEDPKTKWFLRLYPNGNEEETKEFVSLYLYLKESNREKVLAKYESKIIDGKHQIYEQTEDLSIFDQPLQGWGYARFISRSLLLNRDNRLLPNNRLTVYCCVTTFTETEVSDQKVEMKTKLKTITEDITALYHNMTDCDFNIVVKGHEFSAHKLILKMRSPVFAAMFEHPMKEKLQNQLIIEDIDKEVFERVLRFIYTDKVEDKDIDSNIKLLFAANKYLLQDLKTICEQNISSQLNVENVIDVLIAAQTYSAEQLRNAAIVFIGRLSDQLTTDVRHGSHREINGKTISKLNFRVTFPAFSLFLILCFFYYFIQF